MPSIIDSKTPQAIRDAIEHVSNLPNKNFQRGRQVLEFLMKVPDKELTRDALWQEFGPGVLSLSFGWFCKEVAKELGDPKPPTYALMNTTFDPRAKGADRLQLKRRVTEAMQM